MRTISTFISDESGATTLEYGMLAASMFILSIGAAILWQRMQAW